MHDGNQGFDQVIDLSTSRMAQIVGEQIDAAKLRTNTSLVGASCSAASITNAIDNLNAGPDDAILVYFIGHGAYDSSSGGHFFDFNTNDLPRNQVSNRLQNKGARLTVFVSESCNKVGQARLARGVTFGPGQGQQKRALQDLLMNYRGTVDVNSTQQGQLGWGDGNGGYFSQKLFSNLDANPSNANWQDLINQVGQQANTMFQDYRQQKLNQYASNPVALNDPNEFSIKTDLDSQSQMTPAIYQMSVSPR